MNKILIGKIVTLTGGLMGIVGVCGLTKIIFKLRKENSKLKEKLLVTEAVLNMGKLELLLNEKTIELLKKELEQEKSKTKKKS